MLTAVCRCNVDIGGAENGDDGGSEPRRAGPGPRLWRKDAASARLSLA